MITLRAATVCNVFQPRKTRQPLLTKAAQCFSLSMTSFFPHPSQLPIKVTRSYVLTKSPKVFYSSTGTTKFNCSITERHADNSLPV